MKKFLGTAAAVFCAAVLSAESISLLDAGNRKSFNAFGNVKSEPEAESVSITFGGVNQQKWGGFQIYSMPKLNAAIDRLEVTFMGDGSEGAFAVGLRDAKGRNWCWKGDRWEKKAMVSMKEMKSQTLVCMFRDFVPEGRDKSGKLNPAEVNKVQLVITSPQNDRQSYRFSVFSIVATDGKTE